MGIYRDVIWLYLVGGTADAVGDDNRTLRLIWQWTSSQSSSMHVANTMVNILTCETPFQIRRDIILTLPCQPNVIQPIARQLHGLRAEVNTVATRIMISWKNLDRLEKGLERDELQSI